MATRATHEAQTDSCTYEIDFPPPQDSTAALSDACAEILAYIGSLSQDYIWHKQPFQLDLSPEAFTPTQQQQHRWLEGKTDVTDAVDDEWFIVWLLRNVTLKWHDAAVQIEDDDGEFLLIEAADALPSWVTPQNAANRVWIYRGRLHLVPLEHKSALPFGGDSNLNPSFDPDEEGFLDRATALELVRNEAVNTLAPQEVQDAVWARIDGYPAKIREHHHHTLAYLPTDIALALSDSPSLIAEAVGAFYEREPGMLKAVNTMSRFPPASPSQPSADPTPSADTMSDDPAPSSSSAAPPLPDPGLVPTRMTRPLYSQLILQRFYAPKPFLKAGWMEGKKGREDERRREVGMKIACGFEMLYQLTAPKVRHDDSAATSFDSSDPKYRTYLKSLAEKGFFGEEVEGSEAWREKERIAREGWLRTKANRPTLSFAQRVDDAVARARAGPTPLANRIADPTNLSAADAAELEDSEDWLSLDEQGLEDILSARSSKKGPGAMLGDSDLEDSDDDDVDDEDGEGGDGMQGVEEGEGGKTKQEKAEERRARKAAKRLEAMAGKVEDFVEGRGAVSGALFDDEQDGDGADSDEDDNDIDMPEMSAEERAARMEKLVAALPAEQWGQKPDEVARAAEAGVAAATVPPLESTDAGDKQATKPVREPKLTRNEYEGASDLEDESDDEAMPEGEEGLGGLDVEGEEGPSVLNEEDVLDLGEEMDEFLKFATETLGLSESQYEKILQDRRDRGAFVPGPAKEKKVNIMPSSSSSSNRTNAKKAHFAPQEPSPAAATAAGNPPPPRERLRNPNLTDFDSLMEQMEKELAQARKASSSSRAPPSAATSAPVTTGSTAPSGSSRQSRDPNRIVVDSLSDSEDDDDTNGPDPHGDDLSAMDAELSQLLKGLTGGGEEGPMDYNLVKNFLDSFQSQGGFAGPAGNLAGRLGFPLPRDAPSE
ncbi:hypothetical protein JCM10908_002758 [Rhodotorula pacifica]|uniref:uncharacterized protein n=1 Tax=Rhodotorula pacifica TaxID=1495444 RepID=UPI00316D82B4